MSESVARAWGRITEWLASNLPDEAARIAPPAPHDAVAAVRSAMGGNLPADLVAWWALQNGFTDGIGAMVIPPWFSPASAEYALRSRDSWVEHWNSALLDGFSHYDADDFAAQGEDPFEPGDGRSDAEAYAAYVEEHLRRPAGSACTLAFLPAWLPIADGSSSGDLFVDLREGPEYGCVRWFERTGGAENGTWWPSVSAMLAETADALCDGIPVRGHVQTAGGGGYLWRERPSAPAPVGDVDD